MKAVRKRIGWRQLGTLTALSAVGSTLLVGVAGPAHAAVPCPPRYANSASTTASGTCGIVPVHIKGPAQSRVLGEYGVDAYIVTYDVQDYWILDFKKCNVNGSPVRETRNAPTIVETWRFRLI